MEMTYSDRARELKSIYTKKYQDADDETLALGIQAWMDRENGKNGYLRGLSPACNITQIAQMVGECGKCTKPEGNCFISNVLRNMAAMETLLMMIENKNIRKADEALEILEDGYEPYVMLHEFTRRICDGVWHSEMFKPQGNQ